MGIPDECCRKRTKCSPVTKCRTEHKSIKGEKSNMIAQNVSQSQSKRAMRQLMLLQVCMWRGGIGKALYQKTCKAYMLLLLLLQIHSAQPNW